MLEYMVSDTKKKKKNHNKYQLITIIMIKFHI